MIEYTKLLIGSKLWGTATPESDLDYLSLVIPTKAEVAANRRLTYKTVITDAEDIRYRTLGDFVMTLGTNVEDTITALQYPGLFGPLTKFFLRDDFVVTTHDAAARMLAGAKTRKAVSHAVRTFWMAHDLSEGRTRLTPLSQSRREAFHAIRAGDEVVLWKELAKWDEWIPDPSPTFRTGPRDTEALADWAMERYLTAWRVPIEESGIRISAGAGAPGYGEFTVYAPVPVEILPRVPSNPQRFFRAQKLDQDGWLQ